MKCIYYQRDATFSNTFSGGSVTDPSIITISNWLADRFLFILITNKYQVF